MSLSKREKRLLALEEALDALDEDAMLASEFDGFAAGLITCPETIPPSEWLPCVWGANPEGPDCPREVFDLASEMIMAHYDEVAATLQRHPQTYTACYSADPRNGEILWEFWVDGFRRAMELGADAWFALMQAQDTPAGVAASVMTALCSIASPYDDDMELADGQIEALKTEAPSIIPGLVTTLYAANKANRQAAEPAAPPAPKPGRNDPCPCGSGRKYKKCCGAG